MKRSPLIRILPFTRWLFQEAARTGGETEGLQARPETNSSAGSSEAELDARARR
jgi:hypothetical protein